MARKNIDDVSVIKEVAKSDLNEPIKDMMLKDTLNKCNGDESGVLDKIFGKRHPDLYITCLVAICILIIGGLCSYLFRKDVTAVKELWQIFIPALTLVMGYMFGKKKE